MGLAIWIAGIIIIAGGMIIAEFCSGLLVKTRIVGLVVCAVIGLGMVCGGAVKSKSDLYHEPVEYEIKRVIHYQALNAEEINQVWLKKENGDYFYILVNDKTFMELREENEDGVYVMRLAEVDFEKIMRSK